LEYPEIISLGMLFLAFLAAIFNTLSIRGRSQNRNKNKSLSGRSKSRGRSKSPGEPIKRCAGNEEKKGTTKGTVNLKLLTKERDLMMLLLQRRKPP